MNNQGNFEEDILKQYLNPEKIEKAPENFTNRLMAGIGFETVPGLKSEKRVKKYIIPVISSVFTAALIIITFLLPESSSPKVILPGTDFIKNLDFALPDLSIGTLPSFDIPVVATYLLTGILLLGLLDFVLSGLFHRGHR
jgi:hypothetical protein